MMFRPPWISEYKVDPVLSRALDMLFILHADHEQNCSTFVMRSVGSSHPDPYICAAASTGALYGSLHGGATEEVLKMLTEIGFKEKVPEIIRQVKDGKRLLMGFGHRVYRVRSKGQDYQEDCR